VSRVLYFDCFSGISGDMALGALLDAGLPFDDLKAALGSLALGDAHVHASKVLRAGLSATKFSVHDHAGGGAPHAHDSHDHEHPVHGSASNAAHPHRHLSAINKLIDTSALSALARERANDGQIAPPDHQTKEIGMLRRQAIVWAPVIAFGVLARAVSAQPAGVQGGVVGAMTAQVQTAPPPPPSGVPLRVGSGISPPVKVKDVRPVYPAIAQSARVQGVVVLEATIGADGTVSDARVLRSIPLLDAAAIDAVKQWVYQPTMLNGVAVPVIMTVTVNFSLMESIKLKVTDRSGVVTVVQDPEIDYAIDATGGPPVPMRDGIRLLRGSATMNVRWALVDTITFGAVSPGAPPRVSGEILLKSGERTPADFLVPAGGGALRGKTNLGDYAIALKDIATIVTVATSPNPMSGARSGAPDAAPGGAGVGSGIGRGSGSGLGPGSPARGPDGSYRPGGGVTVPRLLREVRPNYTAEAMKAKIQGSVLVECVVLPDGTVGNTRVRSLDKTFGLDESAIAAAKQWRFEPGTRDGVAVPVLVTIELTFTLKDKVPADD